MGFCSVTLLHFIYLLFPPDKWLYFSAFKKYFYVVALREETAKFLAFLLLVKYGIKRRLQPISYMLLSASVGLGFAIEENMIYYQKYGEQVLLVRQVTSTLAHMFFGGFAGYWFALGKLNTGLFGARSTLGTILKSFPKVKLFLYSIVGLLIAVVYHGLWNYGLSTAGLAANSLMIFMIFMGLFLFHLLSKNLIKGFREKAKEKLR